jgi:hypothetical protein
MYCRKSIIELIDFPSYHALEAAQLFCENPSACSGEMERIKKLYPNFAIFLEFIENSTKDKGLVSRFWFRIWFEIEKEKKDFSTDTIELLASLPDVSDVPIELNPDNHTKPLKHCFEVMHTLIS